MIDLFLLLSQHPKIMLFVATKSIPSCHVTCESPTGEFPTFDHVPKSTEEVLAERPPVTRHVSVGTNTTTDTVTRSAGTNTEHRKGREAGTNTEGVIRTVTVSSGTNTDHVPDRAIVSTSTNTPPYNPEQAIISNKLEMLSHSLKGYRETRERVDTIRDLHQALNQAKTLNLLLRQRLKEIRHECNLLMNSNAHLPPVDPLYQAVWMAGVFPQDKFVLFYRQNSQRIQLLYIQYLYKFGGSESEVCHSYAFQLFLREYLGCATNVRPMGSRGGSSVGSRAGSSGMGSSGIGSSGMGSSTMGSKGYVSSRSSSGYSEMRSESRGYSTDSQLWCLEE